MEKIGNIDDILKYIEEDNDKNNEKKPKKHKKKKKKNKNLIKREIIKKNIYKKVEKLAYKDELEYFNRANIKASLKDKIFCSITPMINFIGENNIPDRDTDLKKRVINQRKL